MLSQDLGSFDDDDALDWIQDVIEEGDLATIEEALRAVVDEPDGRRDAGVCSIAVGAAEVVAAIHGRPAKRLPDILRDWLAEKSYANDDQLVSLARKGVKLVAEDSELRETWSESEDFDRWKASIVDLMRRLT